MEGRCEILFCDYRDLRASAPFDKVASVGMFEHVGLAQLGRYFGAIHDLMREEGLFLNHGICSSETDPAYVAGNAGDFIDRYVFPYHELPHMSLTTREMSRSTAKRLMFSASAAGNLVTALRRKFFSPLPCNKSTAEKSNIIRTTMAKHPAKSFLRVSDLV